MEFEQKLAFSKLLTGLAELYGKGVSTYLFEIYWYSLEKYSLDEVKHAINRHIMNPDVGQFMPKPADFVRYLEGKSQERAVFAWEKVLSAMKTVGAYESIVFDDPFIHYVIEKMGGWVVICHSCESKLSFLFQEFSRYYLACLARGVSEYPKKLVGITEHMNRLCGDFVSEPVFFARRISSVSGMSTLAILAGEVENNEDIKNNKKREEHEKHEKYEKYKKNENDKNGEEK